MNEKDGDTCTAGSNGPTVDIDDISSVISESDYSTAQVNEKDSDTCAAGSNGLVMGHQLILMILAL